MAAFASLACGLVLTPALSGGAGAASGSGANPGANSAAPSGGISVPSPVCRPRTTPIPSGPATLVHQSALAGSGGRILTLTLDSPAMGDQQHVDVLLPRGYDASGRTRYPVLYLLHGAGGSFSDWVTHGVEADIDYTSVADHVGPFITVMPDDGKWGFYSDWYGSDIDGASSYPPPAWTTYDIDELIPWVDAHFPTVASRSGRAIAGLSMGGFGAMSYAARYPDLFTAAGSFSGAVDTDLDYPVGSEALNLLSSFFTQGAPIQCIWGDPVTQGVVWHADDPTYLAENLASVSLFVASGNGNPGIYDQPGTAAATEDGLIERAIYLMNQNFTAALNASGVPFTQYFYGAGTHSWGYWLRDLAHFLPQMWRAFSSHATVSTTAPFSMRSAAPTFASHGYTFSVDHVAEDFTYLSGVGVSGLSALGTGTLSVLTSANYTPGRTYEITTDGSGLSRAALSVVSVVADGAGRLWFTVNLGGPVALQQVDFTTGSPAGFEDAQVNIRPQSS
jgi:S-formylglutathione hydrolase FrmB